MNIIVLPVFKDLINGGLTIGHDPEQESNISLYAIFLEEEKEMCSLVTFVTNKEVKGKLPKPITSSPRFFKTALLDSSPNPILGSRVPQFVEDELLKESEWEYLKSTDILCRGIDYYG